MENYFDEFLFDMVIESVDTETIKRLRSEKVYQQYVMQQEKIVEKYPVIEKIFEKKGAVSLTAEEHDAMLEYYQIQQKKETAERKGYYWCGQKHAFCYLKMIEEL